MKMGNRIKVMIAEENKELCETLSNAIEGEPGFELVAKVSDGADAVAKVAELAPDVVVLSSLLPSVDGIGVVEASKRHEIKKKPI